MTKENIYQEKINAIDECIKNDEELLKIAEEKDDLTIRMQLTSEIGSLKMMRINAVEGEIYRLEQEEKYKKQQAEYDEQMQVQRNRQGAMAKIMEMQDKDAEGVDSVDNNPGTPEAQPMDESQASEEETE